MKQKIVGIFLCMLMIFSAVLIPVSQAGCPCESEKSNNVENQYDIKISTSDTEQSPIIKNVPDIQQKNIGLNSRTIQDFETNDGGYTHFPKTVDAWEWGIPTSGPMAAHSGSKCWATNLSGNYPPNMWCCLVTPAFVLSSDAFFSFWHWYSFETSCDGGNVKISTDGGATWTLITPIEGYPGILFYNPYMTNQSAYTGNSNGWTKAEFDLSAYVGQSVKIMWETASDSTVQYPGWYIDDVGFTSGEECNFDYYIAAWINEGVQPFLSSTQGCGYVTDDDFDKFIVNLDEKFGSDVEVVGIENLSITFDGKTYYGNPASDIFITDRKVNITAWIVSNPRHELHAGKKLAKHLNHPFNYTITAEGTWSPKQNFFYAIRAFGTEQYHATQTDSQSNYFTVGAKLFKKVTESYSKSWYSTDPLNFTKSEQISITGSDKKPQDKGIEPKPSFQSQTKIATSTVQASNRGLGFCKGWVNALYELTQEGTKERDWQLFQYGYNNVTDGQGNKYIDTYNKGNNSGEDDAKGVTINYDATAYFGLPPKAKGPANYKPIIHPNVELTMNGSRLYAITFYREPWINSTNGSGSINVNQGVREIGEHNVSAPNNDTRFSAKISVDCKECNQPTLYTDKNGDGIVECGQFIAWMDGANALMPVDYKLMAAFDVFPPSAFISSIKNNSGVSVRDGGVALFGENVTFKGNGTPSTNITAHVWRSHKDGVIYSIIGSDPNNESSFTTNSLSPANPHLIKYNVLNDAGIFSPLTDNSTETIIVNKPPIAYINYIRGSVDSEGNIVSVVGTPVEFSGLGIDTDGWIDQYSWRIDDWTSIEINGVELLKQKVFTINRSDILGFGEHIIRLKVKDNVGTWSQEIIKKINIVYNPVLLVHDYLATPTSMEDIKQALETEGFKVYSMDLRKPQGLKLDASLPLKIPGFKAILALSKIYTCVKKLKEDWVKFRAVINASEADSDDAVQEVLGTISELRSALILIKDVVKETNEKELMELLDQADENLSKIQDKLLLKFTGNFSVGDLGKVIYNTEMLKDKLKVTLSYKYPSDILLKNFSIEIPLPEKVKKVIIFLLKTADISIKIPGESTLFSLTQAFNISGIKGSLGAALKAKNIKVICDKDNKIKASASLVISDIKININVGLNLFTEPKSAALESLLGTTDSDKKKSPWTFFKDGYLIRFHKEFGGEEDSVFNGAFDIGITTGKVSKASAKLYLNGAKNETKIEGEGGVPNNFDWRTVKGVDWTTPVKNQGDCNAGWAFASLGALESLIKIKHDSPGLNVRLSEQYMLSLAECSKEMEEPCLFMPKGFAELQLLQKYGAIPDDCFTYQSIDSKGCNFITCDSNKKVTIFQACKNWNDVRIDVGFKPIPAASGSEKFDNDKYYRKVVKPLQAALLEKGPLYAKILVSDAFFSYDNGVFVEPHPEYFMYDQKPAHAVVIVGYQDTPGMPYKGYWICKNSFGTSWGDQGYINIAYGNLSIEKSVFYLQYDPSAQNWSVKDYAPWSHVNKPSYKEEEAPNITNPCKLPGIDTEIIEYPELKISLVLDTSIIKLKLANGDLKVYAGEVGEEIDKIKKETGLSKVSLVGNGMGGDIVQWYGNYGYRSDVDKITLIGAPLHGSDIADYGPKAIKLLIKMLTSMIPAGGALIGKILNVAVDMILGEAIGEMVPHSPFINALNQNDEKCPAPVVPVLWKPNENDTKNPNIKYLVIYGKAPNVFGVTLPLTMIHLHTRVGGWDLKAPFIWTGDLFTVKRSAELQGVNNFIEVDGTHWQLPKREDTITAIKGFLDGTSKENKLLDYREEDFKVSYDVLVNQSSQLLDPIEDSINNSQVKMYNVTLDQTVTNASFSIQYNPIDAYWNNTYQIYSYYSNDLNLSIIDPCNEEISPDDPNVQYNKSSEDGIIIYKIQKPKAGNWSMSVKGTNIASPSNTTNISVFIYYDSTLRLAVGIGTNKSTYKPRESVNISANLKYNGTGLEGANVTAYIRKVINASSETGITEEKIYLLGHGNGNYSRVYTNTSLEGTYNVAIIASSTINGNITNRSAGTIFWVDALPDLTLRRSNISFSNSAPSVGETIFINATISNVGYGNATNATIEFRDNLTTIGSDIIDVTAGGRANASIKWQVTFGNHIINVKISPFNSFLEKSYTNNTANKTLYVKDNEPPIAEAGQNQIARNNTPVFFDASMSTDNVGIVSYVWDLDNKTDSNNDGILDNDPNLTDVYNCTNSTKRFDKTGIYYVTLTVKDAANNIAKDTLRVTVVNETSYDTESPFVYAGPSQEVMVGEPLYFDGSLSSDNYGIASHLWDMDVGVDSDFNGIPDDDVDYITQHPYLEHGYPFPGVHIVKLTVDDVAGNGPVSDYTLVVVKDTTNYICMGDKDCDGVPDGQDNCPECYNPDQADYDKDGKGDCCYCSKIISPFDDAQSIINNATDGDVVCLLTGAFYNNTQLTINRDIDNIIIDGHGATLYGNGTGTCITFEPGVTNVTVQNCNITGYSTGIEVIGDGWKKTFKNNAVYENTEYGFYIQGGGAELLDNVVCSNGKVDIVNLGSAHGDDNTCNTTVLWDDEGCEDCTFNCFNCTIPTDGMNITRNTLLCSGEYYLPHGINIKASGITVKGHNTILIGNLGGAFPPEGWQIYDYSGAGSWELQGLGGAYEPLNSTEFYAQANSLKHSNQIFDVGLLTPNLDLMNNYHPVKLEFDRNFQNSDGQGLAEIRTYSSGILKDVLWSNQTSDPTDGVHVELNFSTSLYVDPHDVRIEFYYSTNGQTSSGKFAIDNVKISSATSGTLIWGPEQFDPITSIGINGSDYNHVKIKDIELSNYYTGIKFRNSGYDSIVDNIVTDNVVGVYLNNVGRSNVTSNEISNNIRYGLELYSPDSYAGNQNQISNNSFENNQNCSVILHGDYCRDNIIKENVMTNGLRIFGGSESFGNKILNNRISFDNEDDAVYLENVVSNTFEGNEIFDSLLHGFFVKNSDSNVFNNNYIHDVIDGILVIGDHNQIENGIIEDVTTGISIDHSENNTISNNTLNNSTFISIYLNDSSNTDAYNNIFSNIYIDNSSYNTILYNIGTDYYTLLYNIETEQDSSINLENSHSNTIQGNCNASIELLNCTNIYIMNNRESNQLFGIVLVNSSENFISDNNITSNSGYGIVFNSSNNNYIYNNYFSNINNSYDDGSNIWNRSKQSGSNIINGPNLGGNYWSDYTGIDTNGDGLGDTLLPYNSSGGIHNGGDWLPLVFTSCPNDVGVTAIISPTSGPLQNYPVEVTVKNFGTNAETDVSVEVVIEKDGVPQYDATVMINNINAGQSINVFFPDWTASETGEYQVTACTMLDTDCNPSNDCMSKTINLTSCDHDVGVTAIISPTSGAIQTFTPEVNVKNYGSNYENFPVEMTIAASGLVPIFSYGFEDWVPPVPPQPPVFPPTGWAVYDQNGGGTWKHSSSGYHTGTGCAYDNYDYPAPNDDWLVTKGTVVGSGGVFSFWLKGYAYNDDTFQVYLSTTGNTVADFLSGTLLYSGTAPSTYSLCSYNLSDYEGQFIYFAIRYTGNDAWYIWVDDVTFPDGTTQGFEGTSGQDGHWPGWSQYVISGTDPDNKWEGVQNGSYPTCLPHGGNWMAEYDSYNIPSGGSARLQHDASFDLAATGSSNIALTFWMYHDTGYSGSADSVAVQVSTDGSTWTTLGTFYRYDGTTGWKLETVDLSAYASDSTVYLAFLGYSSYGNNMFIDDVSLEANGLLYVYDQTVMASLNAGESMNVIFPDWTPTDVGQYTVTACTLLDTDCNPINDCMSKMVNLTLTDTTPPEISNVAATPATQVPDGWVNITCTVTDNIEVDEVYLYIEYPDSIVKSTPTKLDSSNSLSTKLSTIENFSITQNRTGDTYYCNKTYSLPGVYTYHIWASDTSGNQNISADHTFDIINTPPNTPSSPNPANHATGVSVNADLSWTGGDPNPGDTVTYDVYFGATSPPPKIVNNQSATTYDPGAMNYNTKYYWKIVAWDNHGASTAGQIWDFTTVVDTTPPVTSISLQGTMGNNGWYTSPVTITLTATDTQSGVANTFYKIDSGTWTVYTTPVQTSIDGQHSISYYSVDVAGNVETTKTATLKIDQISPEITLSKEQINILTVKFTAEVSDATSGIDRVEFYLDGALQYSDTQSPYEWTWTGVGDHTVMATVFDMAGNSASNSMSTPYAQSQKQNNLISQQINQLLQHLILRHQTIN